MWIFLFNGSNRARYYSMRFITCYPLLFCALASLVNTNFLKINESFFVLCLYVSCIVVYL